MTASEGRFNRRDFLRIATISGVGLVVVGRVSGQPFFAPVGAAPIPGGTLDPAVVPKYATPLLVPPAMPAADTSGAVDYYEIPMRQFSQQILPAGLPSTTVWGYGPNPATAQGGPVIFNAPSLTIEATHGRPVRVRWINELMDVNGNYLPHLLTVDPTLHWANPPGGTTGRDMQPDFTSTPGPYSGPVPIVTHVHGAVGVGDESDGYAAAWYLPAAGNVPAGYATEGSWYEFFAGKAAAELGEVWGPGMATFQYPNPDRAGTKWYHDHVLGMTRLNVYAGPAGFFIIRGGPDDTVLDSRSGLDAVLPGPAPARGDPPGMSYYEIPIAVQDRSFNEDGSLFYPDTRAFFDGVAGPYRPDTDIPPMWNPEFFGNMMMVNGNTWPFHTVEQRRYRLRFLNGCNARFLILDFSSVPGVDVWQIGNEGGFLAAPVHVSATSGNRLLLSPSERADVIVDFTSVPPGSYVLGNVGPDEPFGGGVPGVDFPMADPGTTGQVLEFRIVPPAGADPSTPPMFLDLPPVAPVPPESVTRRLAILEEMSMAFPGAPAEALLGTVAGDPSVAPAVWSEQSWDEPITENPTVGTSEVWEFYNATADAHPIHIHEVAFEVVGRQAIDIDEASRTFQVTPGSQPSPPEAWETGLKDTVIAYPSQVTRVRALFGREGQFVWHCHIVEHEDNEMMRPYRIGPVQPGQPVEPVQPVQPAADAPLTAAPATPVRARPGFTG